MRAKLKVVARRCDGSLFIVTGQEARTLALLVEKGVQGVVAYDFQGGPPFRLPAYTHNLIRHHRLIIETRREAHDGGWHGRFVLHTPVEISWRSDGPVANVP
jgi:hypothetical protein